MPTPKMTQAKLAEVVKRYAALHEKGYNIKQAAEVMGMSRSTLSDYLKKHPRTLGVKPFFPSDTLDIPEAPNPHEPLDELVARRKLAFARGQASDDFHRLVPIQVLTPGPIAICAVGDPHVDDDGCDLGAIERDMTIIGGTEGMYALHVGDITNNWVGRLGRLYAHQTTKASDGIRLAEWMFSLAPPLAVVGGNHDLWNEGMSWLNFCVKQAGVKQVREHGVRLELRFPKGQSVRVHTRHDFPGHSQFNSLHGLRKEHLFGLRDHVNIAGHKHVDAYSVVPSPDGYMQHMLRVSGYKGHDDYAKSLNLLPMKMSPTCALIIDPSSANPAELIKPFWDMAEASDYLTFKRRRAA